MQARESTNGARLVYNSEVLFRVPSTQSAEFKNNYTLTQIGARLPTQPSLPVHWLFPSVCWRTAPREGLAERFPFRKLHGDVGRAVIGLAGFVKGSDK